MVVFISNHSQSKAFIKFLQRLNTKLESSQANTMIRLRPTTQTEGRLYVGFTKNTEATVHKKVSNGSMAELDKMISIEISVGLHATHLEQPLCQGSELATYCLYTLGNLCLGISLHRCEEGEIGIPEILNP